MKDQPHNCPDCARGTDSVTRRDFIKTAGAVAMATTTLPPWAQAKDAALSTGPETTVKVLFESLSPGQREKVCFAWDHTDAKRGLLRTHVSNNWHITEPEINSKFFSADQRAMIRNIFEGIVQPDWHARIDKQLEDDAGGFGEDQNIALFGKPGEKFEFVMTGRHMTLRCDGNSTEHVAFGGPIFYGHAADGFNEGPTHPGNVFWHQAVAANKVYEMLDGRQRKAALVEKLPKESHVAFRGKDELPGLRLSETSGDQRSLVGDVLKKLIEPYRQSDRDEVANCLLAQGGLDNCALAFYREGDIGGDKVWDCWRLEGPAFVWYFRGTPHVHVWVNIADDPTVATNAQG